METIVNQASDIDNHRLWCDICHPYPSHSRAHSLLVDPQPQPCGPACVPIDLAQHRPAANILLRTRHPAYLSPLFTPSIVLSIECTLCLFDPFGSLVGNFVCFARGKLTVNATLLSSACNGHTSLHNVSMATTHTRHITPSLYVSSRLVSCVVLCCVYVCVVVFSFLLVPVNLPLGTRPTVDPPEDTP